MNAPRNAEEFMKGWKRVCKHYAKTIKNLGGVEKLDRRIEKEHARRCRAKLARVNRKTERRNRALAANPPCWENIYIPDYA